MRCRRDNLRDRYLGEINILVQYEKCIIGGECRLSSTRMEPSSLSGYYGATGEGNAEWDSCTLPLLRMRSHGRVHILVSAALETYSETGTKMISQIAC